ncbi:MAG: sigma-70 family RNA polymerase sigma factor [Calothrix sp. C42_A2020_038]|nr:sigma-70 family RNA polymerase sigma factor [Calothrix sp. C42_A2020_038]
MTQLGSAKTKWFESHFPELEDKGLLAALRSFYCLRLKQYRLLGKYEPDEILSEAILRLSIAVNSGKKIYNILPWLRTTGLHIINEKSREETRHRVIGYHNIDFEDFILEEQSQHNQREDSELYRRLNPALKELDVEDRKLLIMRYYGQLAWQDIANKFLEDGIEISTEALRKRGSRALEKLRKIFINKYFQGYDN